PEDLSDAAVNGGDGSGRQLTGTVDLIEALGAEKLVHFHIDASRLTGSDARVGLEAEEGETEGLGSGEIGAATMAAGVARVPPASRIRTDEQAVFRVATERMHLFDPDTGQALTGGRR
ncbi:MAG: ABC transporter ATP-binding protein, partial [Solirubrobacteraceae bacterium]